MAVLPSFAGALRFPARQRPVQADAPAHVLPPRSIRADAPALTRRDIARARRLEGMYRDMYTSAIPDLDLGRPVVVGVTSAIRGEGRTTTALGLCLSLSRDLDVRVLLAELDMEQPSLARMLNLPEQPGLVDVLEGNEGLRNVLHRLPESNVDILPAGKPPASPSRLLRSLALRQLIERTRSAYEVTVLDMPPALASSDIVPLSAMTDGLLLVVRAGLTPTRLVSQAIERFEADKIRGVVLNGHHSKIPGWLRKLV